MPSAISAARTARARDNDTRRAVDGSSGRPAAYATTLNVVFSVLPAVVAICLMAVALAGLRSVSLPLNVTRRPAAMALAVALAVGEMGGDGGGASVGAVGGRTGAIAALGGTPVGRLGEMAAVAVLDAPLPAPAAELVALPDAVAVLGAVAPAEAVLSLSAPEALELLVPETLALAPLEDVPTALLPLELLQLLADPLALLLDRLVLVAVPTPSAAGPAGRRTGGSAIGRAGFDPGRGRGSSARRSMVTCADAGTDKPIRTTTKGMKDCMRRQTSGTALRSQ